MAFQLPEKFSKTVTKPTHNAYIRYLNKLADGGFDTPDKIKEKPFDVIKLINELTPGDDDGARTKRRYYIASVFYVLPESYRENKNPFFLLTTMTRPIGWVEDKKEYFKKKEAQYAFKD